MNEKELVWRETIRQMREEGYAVCIITPEGLDGADREWVESQMLEEAFVCIEENNDEI